MEATKTSSVTDALSPVTIAYPVSSATAVNTAKIIFDIMASYAFLPTILIADKGSVSVSNVSHEIPDGLGITPRNATTKLAQSKTTRHNNNVKENVFNRISEAMAEIPSISHSKLQYNISHDYRKSFSRILLGRVPHNKLDHKIGVKQKNGLVPTTNFADESLKRTQILYNLNKKNVMQSYIRFKKHFDKKAKGSPLQEKDHCYILRPKTDQEGSKIPFRDFTAIGPYAIEKV